MHWFFLHAYDKKLWNRSCYRNPIKRFRDAHLVEVSANIDLRRTKHLMLRACKQNVWLRHDFDECKCFSWALVRTQTEPIKSDQDVFRWLLLVDNLTWRQRCTWNRELRLLAFPSLPVENCNSFHWPWDVGGTGNKRRFESCWNFRSRNMLKLNRCL